MSAEKLRIRPLEDRVVIKQHEAETKTQSGLIIPDIAKQKPKQGIVMAHGPGKPGEPISVKEGDEVLFDEYAGAEIELDGKPYMFMRESNILAIL